MWKMLSLLLISSTERPSPPEKLGVTNVTKDSISLAWSKPEHDGGSKILGYLVEALEKGQQKWVKCAVVKTTRHDIRGLKENFDYFFRVFAENQAGLSEPKELLLPVTVKEKLGKYLLGTVDIQCIEHYHQAYIYFFSVVSVEMFISLYCALFKQNLFYISESPEIDMKGYPSNTVYVRAGSNLKVDIPISGKPLPKVTLSRDGLLVKSTLRFNTETTAESIIINLKESVATDAGKYELTASNSSGTTKATIKIVVLDRPGPPIGPVIVSDVTEDSVTLQWDPPAYDGGSQVTNYIVLKRETSTAAWSEVSSTVARNVTKVMKLTKGEEYQFRIKAENRFGISDHIDSQTVTVKLPYSKFNGIYEKKYNVLYVTVSNNLLFSFFLAIPGPPSTPWVSNVTRESITVGWHEPVSNGGNTVIGYHLEMKDRNSILWQKASKTIIRTTHFKVSTISAGLIYEFRVYAENAAGIGKASHPSEPVIAIDSCGK